jgi:hypothetical protein
MVGLMLAGDGSRIRRKGAVCPAYDRLPAGVVKDRDAFESCSTGRRTLPA